MPEGLQERLRRLRRGDDGGTTVAEPPAAPVAHGDLVRLEQNLLGEAAPLLSLKDRLQRLVAVAERRTRPAVAQPALEDVAPGLPVANERGEYYQLDFEVPLEHLHGDVALGRLRTIDDAAVRVLAQELPEGPFDLGSAVFLDTETTGLAGGSGTAAFLIGIGYVDGDRFRVRQYFMRDYHEEPAQLLGLARDLARFRSVVTFNGKMFDVPLLEARYALQRARFPLSEAPHLDLLHPARRLWKARLVSCRLQSLEAALLRVHRHGDVPGEEIPRIYFDYVRRRDPRAVARIFHHNRLDILSLAALSALAGQWVREEGWAEDARDIVSLGRVLELAQLYDRSEAEYRRALDGEEPEARRLALLRLAARAKRDGAHESAAELWERAAADGCWVSYRELALYHEHRRRDPRSALAAVEGALGALVCASAATARRARADLMKRRSRLRHKLDKSLVRVG
jgi:uncharacterized protein YprB with RNaseH-like and TPR domain